MTIKHHQRFTEPFTAGDRFVYGRAVPEIGRGFVLSGQPTLLNLYDRGGYCLKRQGTGALHDLAEIIQALDSETSWAAVVYYRLFSEGFRVMLVQPFAPDIRPSTKPISP